MQKKTKTQKDKIDSKNILPLKILFKMQEKEIQYALFNQKNLEISKRLILAIFKMQVL